MASSNRYLVDQNNTPVFIHGASPWSLMVQINSTNVELYVSNRVTLGVNAMIVNLIEHKFSDFAPTNWYGVAPFTKKVNGYWDYTSINPDYFTNADNVIRTCGKYGVTVFLDPDFLGYNAGPAGWYTDMNNAGSNTLYAFGQYIGNRYSSFTNIVWQQAGDYTGGNANTLVNAIARGIASKDPNHLQLAEGIQSPGFTFTGPWNVINTVYEYGFYHIPTDVYGEYNASPFPPVILDEANYELEDNAGIGYVGNPLSLRQQAYYAALSGACGEFWDNKYTWQFITGWQAQQFTLASMTLTNLPRLMASRPWYACVPDFNHAAIVSGYGILDTKNYCPALWNTSSNTVMCYVPGSQNTNTTLMAALNRISGTTVQAWWFDPIYGTNMNAGTFSTSGTQSFTTPNTNDWVLVLDDASLNYAPPGFSTSAPVPTANSQQVTTPENTSTNLVLTGSDPKGLSLTYTVVTGPGNGSLVGSAPNLTYTPNTGYVGPDSFTFKVNNGTVDSAVATVSITVAGAGLTNPIVTWTNPANVVYGTALGAQQLDATSDVPGTFIYSPLAGFVPGAGGQSLSVAFVPNDPSSYNSVTQTVVLNVLKAPLTITADNQTKLYGATVPSLSVSFSGFVNGDTAANLATQPSLGTVANPGSQPATYPITVSGATSPNYAISFVNGILTVTPAPLTVTANNQSVAFGAPLPSFSASFTGFVNGDGPASLTSQPTFTTTATNGSPVGSYPITVSGATNPNYSISFVNGSLTIFGSTQLNLQVVGQNVFQLSSVSAPGQVWTVQSSTNFGAPWATLGSATGDVSGNLIFTIQPGWPFSFYRLSYP